jgi:hypothetical protein
MGPTRHTNFPGRAGAGRLLAPAVFQSARKSRRSSVVQGRLTWKPETIQQSRQTLRPCSALQAALIHCPLTARYRRVPAQGVVPAPLPQDPLQANACNSSVHPDLPLSRRRRARRPPSQLELPVAILLLLFTRLQ